MCDRNSSLQLRGSVMTKTTVKAHSADIHPASLPGLTRQSSFMRSWTHRSRVTRETWNAIEACFRVATVVLAVGVLVQTTVAFAQSEDRVKAGLMTWRSSGCADCHGAFANGEKERDESPSGADLRRTRLSADELKLTIRC